MAEKSVEIDAEKRAAAFRDLVFLAEAGAFDFLLEPGAEEHMCR